MKTIDNKWNNMFLFNEIEQNNQVRVKMSNKKKKSIYRYTYILIYTYHTGKV